MQEKLKFYSKLGILELYLATILCQVDIYKNSVSCGNTKQFRAITHVTSGHIGLPKQKTTFE